MDVGDMSAATVVQMKSNIPFSARFALVTRPFGHPFSLSLQISLALNILLLSLLIVLR
jgi:hypothetical protein